jgi:hypothetical protein
MKVQVLDTKEAPVKWWAAQDARQRNLNNKSQYPAKVQARVERMKLALEMVYRARGIYDSYGKKGISLKVDGPSIVDPKNLTLLEQEWAALGVTKKASAQGFIYRFTA